MTADRIFADVTHPVPAIRCDAREGRERLACLVGRTRMELRVVPHGTFDRLEKRPRSQFDGGDLNGPWFEGRTWTRLPPPDLDAFVRYLIEGDALDTYLRLPFSELLPLKVGEARPGAPEPPGIWGRFDAEAAAHLRTAFGYNIAYDGRSGLRTTSPA